MLDVRCWADFSVVAESGDYSPAAVHCLRHDRSCEHGSLECAGFSSCGVWIQQLLLGLVSGIFRGPGLKLCLLLWPVNSLPLSPPGKPSVPLWRKYPSPGLLEWPYDGVASLPQNKTEKETVRWKLCICILFYDLILEITTASPHSVY